MPTTDQRLVRRILDSPSALSLLAANVAPLVGVIAFGWELDAVLLIFWAESGILGLLNVFKIALVAKRGAFLLVPFFIVHYGGFMAGHLVFLCVLFLGGGIVAGEARPDTFERLGEVLVQTALATGLLVVSHGVSFVTHFIAKGEYRRATVKDLFVGPYGRIVILHVTIILGAIPTMLLGSPVAALAVLVAIKTVVDLRAHLREHASPKADREPPPVCHAGPGAAAS